MRCNILSFICLLVISCNQQTLEKSKININVVLDSKSGSYLKANKQRAFYFPKDHGPHLKYRQEWWHFSGNLDTDNKRKFGFHLTFFRIAVNSDVNNRKSAWAPRDIYIAHLAVTDFKNNKFYSAEKISRAAIGLAGAQLFPFHVWLEDWQVTSAEENDWPWLIKAYQKDFGMLLSVNHSKRVVLQGDKGHRITSASGDASYHYSIPRLSVKGKLQINNHEFSVSGNAWFDREWSTSSLSAKQSGWDRFDLQFNNDTEIMYHQIRFKDGTIDPLSQGVIVYSDSESKKIGRDDVEIEPLAFWTSPTSVRYPSQWRITIKPLKKSFIVSTSIANQEVALSTKYYEGAVRILQNERQVGKGYVGLVGYE